MISDSLLEEFTRLSILNKQEIPTDYAKPDSSSFIDLFLCSHLLVSISWNMATPKGKALK